LSVTGLFGKVFYFKLENFDAIAVLLTVRDISAAVYILTRLTFAGDPQTNLFNSIKDLWSV
jgi:hypothetical protein